MQYTTFEQVVDDFEKADAEHDTLFREQGNILKTIRAVAADSRFSDEWLGATVRGLLERGKGPAND